MHTVLLLRAQGISFAHGAHQHQAVHAVADERGLDELRGRRVDLERRQECIPGT